MIPDADGKPESKKIDSDAVMRQLDIELAQKRAEWTQAGARSRSFRTLSLLFLALVVIGIGALFAYYFLFAGMPQQRSNQSAPAADTPAP